MNNPLLVNFENNYFTSNVDNFPFLYITFTGEIPTDEEFEEYMNHLDLIYAQKQHLVMLSDSRKGNYMKSKHRIEFGNWTKKNQEIIEQLEK